MHVATGQAWNGNKTKRGLVVSSAEGQGGARNRIAAFKQMHQLTGLIALALIPSSIDLYEADADGPRLVDAIRTAAEHYGERPVLIVIDTLSRTLGAGKENTDDLATYLSNCSSIAAEFQCCVTLVHHRPKDGTSSDPRGHSSLKGGVDTMISVEGTQHTKVARLTKQRDGEEAKLISFRLAPQFLGNDEDGEPVNSCTIEAKREPAPDPLECALAKLRSQARLAFSILQQTLIEESVLAERYPA